MKHFIKKSYPYFPIFGLIAYVIFFFIASYQYPENPLNQAAVQGYSFFHHFLCDLMYAITPEGLVNTARPIAIMGHFLLSFAMISFFYILPEIFSYTNINTWITRFFGIISMIAFAFLFTDYHDRIVTIVGAVGTVSVFAFLLEIKNYSGKGFRILTYVCLILSFTVFIGYETKVGIYYLPLLQKITFIIDGWWVIWVSLLVAEKNQKSLQVVSETALNSLDKLKKS